MDSDFDYRPKIAALGQVSGFLWPRGGAWRIAGPVPAESVNSRSQLTELVFTFDSVGSTVYRPMLEMHRVLAAYELYAREHCFSPDGAFRPEAVIDLLALFERYGPLDMSLRVVGDVVVELMGVAAGIAGVKALSPGHRQDANRLIHEFSVMLEQAAQFRSDTHGLPFDSAEGEVGRGWAEIALALRSETRNQSFVRIPPGLAVADFINSRLERWPVITQIAFNESAKTSGLVQSYRPTSLLSGLWGQVASFGAGSSAVRICADPECRKVFAASPNSTTRYCPPEFDSEGRGCQVKAKERRAYARRKGKAGQGE